MAVVLPVNCHKPFSLVPHPAIPTFISQKSLANHKRCSRFCTLNETNRHFQRLFPIVNALDKDSDYNTAQDGEMDNIGVKAALSMLRFYKREISPLMPNSCRYLPTCSEYSMQAYKKYGVAKGTILTAWRLCRCNPLGGSGFDPPRWFDEKPPPEQ